MKIKPVKEDKKVTYDIIAKSGNKEMSRVTHTLNVKNVEHKIETILKTPKNIELKANKDGNYENVDIEALVKNISKDERAVIKNMKINVQVQDKHKNLVSLSKDSAGEIKVEELGSSKELTHKWTLNFKKPTETTEIPIRVVYTGENLDKEEVLETKIKLVVEKPIEPPVKPVKPVKPPVKPTKPVVKPTEPNKPETGDMGSTGLIFSGLVGIAGIFGLRRKK